MEEIGTLRTHIIQYAKTRDTYVAYRKAGYSKKFLEAHREEITLHKAAKDAFDKLGLKKLPKVKDLNAAYAEVLSQKKKLYPEYRRARDEMRELLTVKANVDRVLNMEAPEAGRTRSRRRDFCVQMGFGVCTNKHPLAKWIARGIACPFSAEIKQLDNAAWGEDYELGTVYILL